MTGRRVEGIEEKVLNVGGERIPVGLVIWGAGVVPSELGRTLGCETDRAGRVVVGPTLEVPGLPGIFALGHIASLKDEAGEPLPGLAQVAKQQGIHLGRALAAHIIEGRDLPPFVYRSRGNTAIIGACRGLRDQAPQRARLDGLDPLGDRACLSAGRLPEPPARLDPVARPLPDLPPRRAPDLRRRARGPHEPPVRVMP
jgi:NADH dehydrogenase FAD-containing subunit